MLWREDEGPVRQVFLPGDLDARADDLFLQPEIGLRPELGNEPGLLARDEKIIGRPKDHLDDDRDIEGQVEKDRTQQDHES